MFAREFSNIVKYYLFVIRKFTSGQCSFYFITNINLPLKEVQISTYRKWDIFWPMPLWSRPECYTESSMRGQALFNNSAWYDVKRGFITSRLKIAVNNSCSFDQQQHCYAVFLLLFSKFCNQTLCDMCFLHLNYF